MSKEKKLRAAMTAVMAYIREDEQLRSAAPQRDSDTPWGQYSRQTIMNNRAVWQRGLHRNHR